MKKITLMFAFLCAISWHSQAQLFVSEDFDSGIPNAWSGSFSTSSTNACEGESARKNMYSFTSEADLVTPNYEEASNGTDLTVSFDYKIIDYSGSTATPAGWGTAELQYSTDDGGAWSTIYTIDDSSHTTSSDCASVTAVVPEADIPLGSDIKLRVFANHDDGDYYFIVDNFETAQVIDCTFPEATTDLVQDCVNGNYTINVDVTDMGDATSLTLTNDAGAPDITVTETGVVEFGPVPAGITINLALEHTGNSECNVDLGTFKDTCPAPNDTLAGATPITPSAAGTGCDTFTFAYDYGDGSVSDSGLDGSCDGSNTGYDLFFSWTATSAALIWNDGDSNPGIVIREADGTEITCESTFASDDTELSGWNIGDDLIIQVYDYGTSAEPVSFCLEELTCPDPTNLQATNLTTNTVDLTWEANGAETEWTVIWGEEGFDPETDGTTVIDDDGDAGISLTGLTESTSYEFYVQANCGVGDESALTGPQGFSTSCEATSDFPLTQNFDGNWSGSPEAPLCWTVINNDGDSYTWTKSGQYITPRSGSSVAHGMGNSDDYLITPALEFLATDEMQIRWFDIVESASQNNTYDVLVSTTSSDVSSFTENLGTFDTTNEEWEERVLDLSAYAGETIYVAFHQTYSGSSIYGFGIDDVSIEEIPSCFKPENVAVSAPTTTSVDLTWDEEPGATNGYELSAFEADADPSTDTPVSTVTVAAGETTGTVTGLSASTFYDFYVASDCDANGMSAYSDPAVSLRTECEAITSFPLTEDFDGTWQGDPAAPGCWTVVNNDEDSYTWTKSGQYITPRSGDFVAHGTGSNDDYLISPALELPAGDAMQVRWYDIVEGETHNNTYEVLVSTTDTDLNSFTESLGTFDVTNTDWEEHTVDLSSYAGTTIYVAFYQTYSSATYWGFGIDDVSIEEAPSCFTPSNLVVSNVTSTSVDLEWDAVNNAINGYVYYAFESGDDPETDTAVSTDVVAAGETSVTVTGLSDATPYDFYMVADCDADGLSSLSMPVSSLTSCEATDIPFIQDFEDVDTPDLPTCGTLETISGNDWKTSNETSNGFDSNVLKYSYSSSDADTWYFTQGVNLEAGVNYQISYQYGNNSTSYTENLKVAYGTSASSASMTEDLGDHTISLSGSEIAEVAFTVPADGVYYFGFQAYSVSGQYYLYVDDIQIDLAPACIKPSNLIASNVNGNSFDLDWDAISTETDGYEWFVMASGENPDVDTPIQTGTTGTGVTTVSITGLSETTTYDVYVRTDCGVEGMSDYSDTLTVETTVTCAAPTDLALNETNVTSTSAEFTWTVSASEELGYDWVVMAEGEDPAVDTPIESGTTNPGDTAVTVTGLTAATVYDFYILSNCDANGLSDYEGPESFQTACETFVPDYLEDFSGFLPVCWEEAEDGDFATGPASYGSGAWTSDGFLNNGSSGAARINLFTTTRSEWLISPAFDLSVDGYEVVFDIGITAFTGSDNSAMGSDDEVYALYSLDGVTWTVLQTWEAGSEPSNTGETVAFDLSGITGANVKFAIYATDGDVNDSEDYNIYIDNFKVRTPLICPEIQELTVSSVTATEAELSWMDNAEAVNGYVWSVFEEGEDPETATAVATGTTAAGETTAEVTGLMSDTSYDAYVQADCDADGMSFLTSVSFTTLIEAIIVTPGTTETIDHCYENNDLKEWIFESSDGSPLTIEFEQGTLETSFSDGTYDDLMIYDGSDETGIVLYDSDNATSTAGELAGLIFTAESGLMYMTLDADGSNSCGDGDQTEIIFNVDAGTASNSDFFSDANFSYYPNPVESRFVINSTYALEQIVIYNMLGQEVRDISPQSTEVSFDLSDVQAGVYLVKATVEGQTQTFRLIKE